MRNLPFSIFCIFLFFIFSVKTSWAYEKEIPLFVDNFTSNNDIRDALWIKNNIGGQIEINNGLNLISENSTNFPFLVSNTNIFPAEGDFYIKVIFKYLETTGLGVGFGFGNINPGYGITDWHNILDSDLVKFQVWQGNVEKFNVETYRCSSNNMCDSSRTKVYTALPDINQHTILIKNVGGVTEIFIDDIKTESSPITNTNWRPTIFWIGNPSTQAPNDWTDLKIVSIETGTLKESSGPIDTIIIPGLGASWDMGAIMSGTDGTSWQVPSFVKVYDGLKNSFINAGYSDTTNQNLFIFPYDWRKPLSVLAERLNAFIDTNIPAGEKVNLVGHSMGGLVARTYAQNYGTSKINKIVTVGSPNMGIVKAYGIWEGATIWDDVWWGKVALDLTTHFGANVGESSVQTIRRLTPSIKGLLPTYDYLKLGDTLLPWASLTQKNDYLNDLNLNASQIYSLTTAIYSKDIGTDSLIKVVAHSSEDLDMWIDGKPIPVNPFETALGDGTVTETSAKGLFTNNLQGTGWHGELVTKNDNIQKIFGVLGLDPLKALSGVDESRKKVFVAALRSPGVLEVCDVEITKCNNQLGLYFPNDKLFMLPGYNDENLVVRVTEDGEGAYKLHLGNIDNTSNWTVVSGNLERDDQVDFYNIQSNNQVISATLIEPELPDTTPPSVPTNGQPNGSFLSTNEFDFIWDESTDNKEGEISYEHQASLISSEVNGILTTNLWHSPMPLLSPMIHSSGAPDGTWYWQVRARDSVGNDSAWSQIWAMTIDSIKPSLISKTIFSGWYKTPQTSSFVYADTNLKNDYVNPDCLISTEGQNQTCGILLDICDKAGNCNTDPQTSNGVNLDMTAPRSIFTLPTLSNNWGGAITGTAVDGVSGVARVELIIKNPNGMESTVVASGTANWSYTIPVLTEGKYIIRSRATDVAGNIENDLVEQQIVLDMTAPNAPKIIFANDWGQKIWLFWSPVKTASSYSVYYNFKKNELTNVRETSNPFWVSDVLSLGKYYVSVTAMDEAGNESTKSNVVEVKVNKKWKW